MTSAKIYRKGACHIVRLRSTSDGQALYLIGAGQAGFTLIEVIIVVVLTSILGVFTFQVLSQSTRVFTTMDTRRDRAGDAVLALEKISREIMDATALTASGSTLTITKKNATGVDSSTYITHTRDTSTNELQRVSAAGTSVVAKNVSNFTVLKDASNRVTILLTFSSGSTWQTTVYPRNYGL